MSTQTAYRLNIYDGLTHMPGDRVYSRHDNVFVRTLFNFTVVHELNVFWGFQIWLLDHTYLPTYHEMEKERKNDIFRQIWQMEQPYVCKIW